MADGILRPVPKTERKPKQPSKPRLRRTRMKRHGKRTQKSGGALFPKLVDRRYRAFVRSQPCVIAARFRPYSPVGTWAGNYGVQPLLMHVCVGRMQACHVKSRGSGGGDIGNLYPGCALAHVEQGRIGIKAFEKRWGVKLAHIAQGLALRYHETGGLSQEHETPSVGSSRRPGEHHG